MLNAMLTGRTASLELRDAVIVRPFKSIRLVWLPNKLHHKINTARSWLDSQSVGAENEDWDHTSVDTEKKS